MLINIDSQKAKVYVAVRMMMVLFVAILLFPFFCFICRGNFRHMRKLSELESE